MRIRRRSNPLSSPPLVGSPASVFSDLSAHAHPAQGQHGGRDSDTWRGAPAQGLNSDEGDLKKDQRTLSRKPTRTPYPPPCEPHHLALDGSKGDPTVSAPPHQCMIHLKLGLVQVLRRNAKEGDGTKRWRNSNLRSSSSAALSVSAVEEHGGSYQSQKKEKQRWNESAKARNSSCSANGDDDRGRCKGGSAAAYSNGKTKRRRGPAVLMEGSRCSRVNGRGWRCCQQTLVGYSLCEHHLGKGRLRSVTGQLGTTTTTITTTANTLKTRSISGASATSKSPHDEEILDREQLQPWPLHYCFRAADAAEEKSTTTETAVKRKKKLGVGKARTISSLLDESDPPLTAAASTAHSMRQRRRSDQHAKRPRT